MSGIRTGNFFINSELELRTLQLPSDQYRQMRRKSILLALNWLEENVLNQDGVGHHLRVKIRNGVTFDDTMHIYLMNSCLHWLKTVKGGHHPRVHKIKTRPYSSVHQKTKSPPDMIERPMTCPGREICISSVPVDYPKISRRMYRSPENSANNVSRRNDNDHRRGRPSRSNGVLSNSKNFEGLSPREDRITYNHRRVSRSNSRRESKSRKSGSRNRHYNRDRETVNIISPIETKSRHSNSPIRENYYKSKTCRSPSRSSHRPKNITDFRGTISPIRPKVVPKTGIYRNN